MTKSKATKKTVPGPIRQWIDDLAREYNEINDFEDQDFEELFFDLRQGADKFDMNAKGGSERYMKH